MAPHLVLRDVWFRYPGSEWVLKGVSAEFVGGGTYVIEGINGAGKTTLLLVMAGLLEPQRGEVLLDGKPVTGDRPPIRRRFGILFQSPDYMLFNPTVYEEVAYGPRQLIRDNNKLEQAVRSALKAVGLSEKYLGRPTHALSYGEKKLVALASIISYDPDVLLLDEPCSNLSPAFIERVCSIVNDVVSEGGLVVITTQPGTRCCGEPSLVLAGGSLRPVSPRDL